jgi:hypothetical protein
MLVSALWRMISPQYSEGAARCRAAGGQVLWRYRQRATASRGTGAKRSPWPRLHVEERIGRRRSPGRKGMAPGLQKRLEEVSLTAA